ncbi:MAG: hypothetical protein K0R54_813 [Clostridiaceae bacterium]|jgi:hypothetical protein|nr:hypothetical protein [Clostridiaceae bacterium]
MNDIKRKTVNNKYCLRKSYKWHLVRQEDKHIVISDNNKSILETLCDKLNNNDNYTENDCITEYCNRVSRISIFEILSC